MLNCTISPEFRPRCSTVSDTPEFADLIRRVRDRDPDAARELVRRYEE